MMNVLILCTGNSARSVLAEAIFNRVGKGRFTAYSAGSQPKGDVNPTAVKLLADLGYDVAQFRSKSWDEFAGDDAPIMNFVFTVCDSAAGEACPLWPGGPVKAHWGLPDPAAVEGTDEDKYLAFLKTYALLSDRIGSFVNLGIEELDDAKLARKVKDIGEMPGGTALD